MKTNRSKASSYFHCPRYRYWKYHFNGKGMQKAQTKGPTEMGLAIHRGNAKLLLGGTIEEAIVEACQPFVDGFPPGVPHRDELLLEGTTFIEGMVRAFNRCRVPKLLSSGPIIAVEEEKLATIGRDFYFQFRADAIQEVEEGIVVIDFKPTARGDYRWVRKWERSNQILSYVAAAEALYNKRVLGVKIEGYIKGVRRFDERVFNGEVKIQDSPLCYVFVHEASGQVAPEYQRASGWVKTPLWETSLTPKEYVEDFLTCEQVEKLFLAPIPEIAPNRGRLESWKVQTFANEERIENAAALVERVRINDSEGKLFLRVLDEQFPQNDDACYKFGEDFVCEMSDVCFNGEVFAAPLESGLYEERVDHHGTDDDHPE